MGGYECDNKNFTHVLKSIRDTVPTHSACRMRARYSPHAELAYAAARPRKISADDWASPVGEAIWCTVS